MQQDFIDGFACGAGLPNRTQDDRNHAEFKWVSWSNQYTDRQRARIEAGGFESGIREGRIYADHHVEN